MENNRNKRLDIIQPGISISSKYSTNGTLGMIVFDNKNNLQACILSNWHVLAKSSFFSTSFRSGKPIYQPGKLIQGKRTSNIVAKLTRFDKDTDSAIAKITDREFKLNQFESDALIKSARLPKEGDLVEKSGARTGITRGKIVKVNGSHIEIRTLEIDNPENIEISQGGDSGSIWYDPITMEGLVLHNAGEHKNADNPESEFAKGYSLIQVMKKLDFSLVTE